ncbi:MAG: DUF4340 domain-containing protein [Nitrospirae bacterium]|nr:MAG: DUF4340 domain-containing protein [Nitrospirota bacterium]
MRTKTVGVLAGITLVVILVAVWQSWQDETSLPEAGSRLFPELMDQLNDVTTIVITTQGGTITVAREGDRWIVKEKNAYPADLGKVRETLIGLAELAILEPKTKNPDLYPKLGLQDVHAEDSLSTKVELRKGDTVLATVILGNQRPARGDSTKDEIYVRRPDDPQTWLVVGHLEVDRNATEWLDKKILDIETQRIQRVRVTHPDGTTLTLEKAKPDELDFKLVDMPSTAKLRSQFAVNNVVSTLSGLTLDDVRPAQDVSVAQPVTRAVLETRDGLEVTVKLWRKEGTPYVTVQAAFNPALVASDNQKSEEKAQESSSSQQEASSAEADAGQEAEKPTALKSPEAVQAEVQALNERVSEWVYQIATFKADAILKKPEDLLEPADS